jgi:hypothetical protein
MDALNEQFKGWVRDIRLTDCPGDNERMGIRIEVSSGAEHYSGELTLPNSDAARTYSKMSHIFIETSTEVDVDVEGPLMTIQLPGGEVFGNFRLMSPPS